MENHIDSATSMHAARPEPRLDALWQALRLVIDPELGVDIVTLGLVYDAVIEDGVARVTHTLTTPNCPMEAIISQGIRDALAFVEGVRAVELHLVWDPAWHPGMIARPAVTPARTITSSRRDEIMKTHELLDRTLTVNETVARFPQTIAVFNRLGIDSCCGGALPLDDAARHEGVDPDALYGALTAVLEKA